MKNKAFTLLELLVVITIIGILSSIVIVSMSGSTDSATIAKGKAYAQQVHALLGANAVGVWNFDEGTGTTLTDISGYGNDGTLNKGANGTGLDWVASDIEGTALQFDGVDDYVDVSTSASLNITVAITIEAWVKPVSGGSYPTIVGKGNPVSWRVIFALGSSREVYFYISGVYQWVYTSGTNFFDGNWHHIVGMYDKDGGANNMKIYIDGIIDGQSTQTGIPDTGNAVRVGKRSDGPYPFKGLIDGVRIYAEALPSTEIQKHYVQGLEKLLADQIITQVEYDQRIEEFNKSLVRYEK
jgi:prepilin-type N-terminal cleavage/methylation domain-containing protein